MLPSRQTNTLRKACRLDGSIFYRKKKYGNDTKLFTSNIKTASRQYLLAEKVLFFILCFAGNGSKCKKVLITTVCRFLIIIIQTP